MAGVGRTSPHFVAGKLALSPSGRHLNRRLGRAFHQQIAPLRVQMTVWCPHLNPSSPRPRLQTRAAALGSSPGSTTASSRTPWRFSPRAGLSSLAFSLRAGLSLQHPGPRHSKAGASGGPYRRCPPVGIVGLRLAHLRQRPWRRARGLRDCAPVPCSVCVDRAVDAMRRAVWRRRGAGGLTERHPLPVLERHAWPLVACRAPAWVPSPRLAARLDALHRWAVAVAIRLARWRSTLATCATGGSHCRACWLVGPSRRSTGRRSLPPRPGWGPAPFVGRPLAGDPWLRITQPPGPPARCASLSWSRRDAAALRGGSFCAFLVVFSAHASPRSDSACSGRERRFRSRRGTAMFSVSVQSCLMTSKERPPFPHRSSLAPSGV